MKYDITCSCGHEITVDLFGKSADRERDVKYYEGRLCPECYKAAAAKEAEASIKAAGDKYQLPELTGSEKQVSWAEAIRAKVIEEYDKEAAKAEAQRAQLMAAGETDRADLIDRNRQNVYDALMAMISRETTARYYIDNRDELSSLQRAYRLAVKR